MLEFNYFSDTGEGKLTCWKTFFCPSTANMIKNVFNYRGLKMWKNLEEKSAAGFTFLSKLANDSLKILFFLNTAELNLNG